MQDTSFWQSRLEKKKTLLVTAEDALQALLQEQIESYTLDTGQSRQTALMLKIDKVKEVIDGLENDVATLNARISGCGTAIVRPCW